MNRSTGTSLITLLIPMFFFVHPIPSFAVSDDIVFSTFGLSGGVRVGPVRLAGGIGHAKLDLGKSDIINETGETIGSFESGD